MQLTLTLAATASMAALIAVDDGEERRLEPGEPLTLDLDEDNYSEICFTPVPKAEAPAPSFEQPRPDAIASNPDMTSATAPGAQAVVESVGAATAAGEPIQEVKPGEVPDELVPPGSDLTEADGGDTEAGGQGSDTLSGGQGSDTEAGGQGGEDTLSGGQGEDTLTGDRGGGDTTGGREGQDALTGGQGYDTMAGGQAEDTTSGDTATEPREPTDDEIRDVMRSLETEPSVEKTQAGKIEVNTINEALSRRGLKPIKAAKRDELS